ncbi:amidase signature domain-containing protein [Bombardia bombarda]|uniref:Amidase signature domain-containing protein n=1 Tax=Bombardia bombarda TaxID=252184 RepID=A0AA39WCD7_9PEZI|nr:amidase signature domain-containing protein [Bombardia bombarda]
MQNRTKSSQSKILPDFRKPTTAQFNVLTSTLGDISRLLDEGKLTSVDLVKAYTAQIKRHNHDGLKLHALISVVPEQTALEIAKGLDEERVRGNCRSRLHGIPFIAKDTMSSAASLGMPTSCGTYALKNSLAKDNADIVQKLIDAGMILIGKANLSELASSRTSKSPAGYSTAGGQTQSAYVVGGCAPGDSWLGHSNPGGSSTGSAVSVSAGMTPVALGTESDGSITMPSDRAALYSIKLSPGAISWRGVLPYTRPSDALGAMTKSPEDSALMLNVLLEQNDFTKFLGRSFKGLKIGFLDPVEWASGPGAVKPNKDYNKQYISEFSAALDKIEAAGAIMTRNISLRRVSSEDDKQLTNIIWHDFPAGFEEFTAGLIEPPVRTLPDLVDYNTKHADQAMPPEYPGQDTLEQAVANMNSTSREQYAEYCKTAYHNNKVLGLDAAFEKYDVDVIIGAPTGRCITVYDWAGYPVGTLPLGYAQFNGRPFGLAMVAPKGREDLIIGVMGAWEALFGPRKPPPQLVDWVDKSETSL